jgi:hypothetical protein
VIENSIIFKKSLRVLAKRPFSDEVNIENYVKEGIKKIWDRPFPYVNEYSTL